jgi:NADPH:quinone reductase-like Zn-dependent oxidoreductase
MKAAVIDQFGPSSALQVRDIPTPEITVDQILVEVHAASVNPIDWKIRDGMMGDRYGKEFPMVLGLDASGVVVKVGDSVTEFKEGDEVYARSDNGAGKCYAEYVALNPGTVALKPESLSHVEAAAIPLAALTPLIGMRDCAGLKAGDRILIIGASGGVGIFAVQIAKLMGAEVTAVCSTRNIDLARELGADRVIDYTQGEVLQAGDDYDVIYDTVGAQTYESAKPALKEEGIYLTLVPVPGIDFFIPGQTERMTGKGYFVAWTPHASDLRILSDWVASGQLRPVIDSEYPLEEIRQAHERSQTLRAQGKIIIRMDVDG